MDSNVTGCDSKFCCKCKREDDYDESNNESYSPPPGIGFSFAMCHSPLSQEADSSQLLVDLGSSKHFIDPELIRWLESRMLECTRIEPLMKIRAAGNNVSHDTAKGILLVVVRGTDDILKTVKLPIVLVPGLKRNVFSTSTAAQKCLQTIIEKRGSSLDLGLFSVQLTRLDNMEHLNLTITK